MFISRVIIIHFSSFLVNQMDPASGIEAEYHHKNNRVSYKISVVRVLVFESFTSIKVNIFTIKYDIL